MQVHFRSSNLIDDENNLVHASLETMATGWCLQVVQICNAVMPVMPLCASRVVRIQGPGYYLPKYCRLRLVILCLFRLSYSGRATRASR